MVASSENAQSHVYDVLRLLSAGLPTGGAGITLVVWTLVGVLAVRLSVYAAKFIMWQIKTRRAAKQFPVRHEKSHGLSREGTHRYHVRWLGPFIAVIGCDHPDNIKPILSNKTQKTDWAYRFFRPWLGDGLVVSEGSKWQRNRRLLTPAFHFDILKHYVKLFSESTNVLLEKWMSRGPGASVELFDDVGLMTLDNILKCSLGYNSSCQTNGQSAPYILAVHDLARLIDERIEYPPYHIDFIYYLSTRGRRFRQACKIVHSFSEQVITERKEELKKGDFTLSGARSGKCLDLLDILLQAKDEDGTGLSVSEIRDEVNTFLFGGHHTTASGISWTLFHLAQNKDYQDKCRREVYDPYRFSPENSENRSPHAFLPFSAGPRNCIGQNFAMNEMKVAIALILQRFYLELDDSKPPAVPCDRLTVQAKDGIWVNVHPLQTNA
ncbi:CYP4F22 [Branchiostoma lanceolatum]|uniref:CYP4F22 protein n=1 Tax=Branchiostoma lanceolatum TaxID=7740 RepID=A0A8J9ZIM8_BRALA|nr:CYP4F22 [Branchiostoma lanceolatum]